MQQYLPFTVLKPTTPGFLTDEMGRLQQYLPFTVLKRKIKRSIHCKNCGVATVLTVYGIETYKVLVLVYESYSLQQYLPFTVLKLKISSSLINSSKSLQQYLPFTVLKPVAPIANSAVFLTVATVLTVYGIETDHGW